MITGSQASGARAQRRSDRMGKAVIILLPVLAGLGLLRALQLAPTATTPRAAALHEAQEARLEARSSSLSFRAPMRSSDDARPRNHFPAVRSAAIASPAPAPDSTPQPGSAEESRRIAELATFYTAASHPADRASIASELGSINSPTAVGQLLELLSKEQDPLSRRDLLNSVAMAEGRQAAAPQIARSLQELFASSTDYEERGLIEEVLAEAPTAESVEFLRRQAASDSADPYERLSAAESLMRISATSPELLTDTEIASLQERLRTEAQAAQGEPEYQSQALMALGGRKEENRLFFQQMLASTQDPNVRLLLAKLAQ